MKSRVEISKAYKRHFKGPGAEEVLEDLRSFCFDDRSTFVSGDSHATCHNEGKRAVLKHIEFYMNIDPSKLEEKPRG